jgi:uncharacterized protein (DUF39 family)
LSINILIEGVEGRIINAGSRQSIKESNRMLKKDHHYV